MESIIAGFKPANKSVRILPSAVGSFLIVFGTAILLPARAYASSGEANAPSAAVDWRLEKTSGDIPSARGGGKLVSVGNLLVMYGGFKECFDKNKCEHEYCDDVYTLNLTTMKWEKKHPTSDSGKLPGKRVFFGGTSYKNRNAAAFFGGAEYDVKVTKVQMYNDLWLYDPAKDKMTEITYANQGPDPRLGPEIVIKDDMLYLFGGYDKSFKAHNELWSFDFRSRMWQLLKKDDDPGTPSKRYIFRFELSDSGDDIFMFGGNYREKFTIQRNDLWRYNIRSNTFVAIVPEDKTNITGRTHGAAAIYGNVFVVALGDIPSGGCYTEQASEHQNPTNEVWSVTVDKGSPAWTRVNIGFSPPPLKRLVYAKAGGRLYVTHGFDYKCDKPGSEGPVYNLKTYSLPLKEMR
ncbi:MAG TPA: kelch repeat-containing protein [Blastocatellia bacterium]|nr:kelch repeat-containing protein [Blastocatellia bacterium]